MSTESSDKEYDSNSISAIDKWDREYPRSNLAHLRAMIGDIPGPNVYYNDKDVMVSYVSFPSGHTIDMSDNGNFVQMWLIVYEGKLKLTYTETGKEIILECGSSIEIPANVPHISEVIEDVRYVAVRLPINHRPLSEQANK